MKKVLLGLSLLALLTGCAWREQRASGSGYAGSGTVVGAGSHTVTPADSSFAREACQTGTAEVQIGKLAARNTKNREVRALARKLADEHARAEKELGQLFVRKSIPPEENLEEHLQSSLENLTRLKGHEFDVAFKDQVIQDHQGAIEVFEKQAAQGTDPDLKAFAQKHLPRLREHLAAAQRLDVGKDYGAPDAATVNTYLNNPAARNISPAR